MGVGSREKQQGVVNVNINVAYRLYCVGRKSLFSSLFSFFPSFHNSISIQLPTGEEKIIEKLLKY